MTARDPSGKRPYRMRVRADTTAATRERILVAAEQAFDELLFDEITLAAVAERAGVSVQTVLRHFENKEGLFAASLQRLAIELGADRDIQPSGEPEEIVADLVDHYEKFGDKILRGLAQEHREPTLRMLADLGRTFHLEWCKQAFAPALAGMRGAKRRRRVAQFVAVTDIYVWKLLRRDRGLSHPQTKRAMLELLEPLLEASD